MSIIAFLRSLICSQHIEPVERPFTMLCPVSGEHVRTILRNAFPTAYIKIADRLYKSPGIEEFNRWIRKDGVSERKYFAEYFDCDNYIRELRCAMFKVNILYKTEITLCYAEGDSPEGYHAFGIFIDDADKVFIVEPQNDAVVPYMDSLYKPDFIQL